MKYLLLIESLKIIFIISVSYPGNSYCCACTHTGTFHPQCILHLEKSTASVIGIDTMELFDYLLFIKKLEYSCFTMLCGFLLL